MNGLREMELSEWLNLTNVKVRIFFILNIVISNHLDNFMIFFIRNHFTSDLSQH